MTLRGSRVECEGLQSDLQPFLYFTGDNRSV